MDAGSSSPRLPTQSGCGTSRSWRAASPRRCSGTLFLQGRPQPLLKVEFHLEDPPHEQDDLPVRVQAVPATIIPELIEDRPIDADVELDLVPTFRGHQTANVRAVYDSSYRY